MKGTLQHLKLPFVYCDTPELRVLDLTADGTAHILQHGLKYVKKTMKQRLFYGHF